MLIADTHLENYRKSVEILALAESNLIFKNSNRHHANIVLTNIFKNSKSKIYLYDDDLSGDIADLDSNFITELTEFVRNRESSILKICIKDSCDKNNFQDHILEIAKSNPGKVLLKKASDQFRNHITDVFQSDLNFAIGDDRMFRLEYGKTEASARKAFCSFNNQEYPLLISEIFDDHFETLESLL